MIGRGSDVDTIGSFELAVAVAVGIWPETFSVSLLSVKRSRTVKAQFAAVWWQADVLLFLGGIGRNVEETDRGSS